MMLLTYTSVCDRCGRSEVVLHTAVLPAAPAPQPERRQLVGRDLCQRCYAELCPRVEAIFTFTS